MKFNFILHNSWRAVLGRALLLLTAFLLLLLSSQFSHAQIIAWDFNGNTGSEATVNATLNNNALATSTLSRGSGVTATALADAYSSETWDAANLTEAKTNNEYLQFSIQANSNMLVSLATLDATFRRTATGPDKFQWEYSLDNFATTGTAIGTEITYTGTGVNGLAQTQIDLSSISALQNVPNSTTITFRLYAYGATSTSGTFALGRLSGNDLTIGGTVNRPNPASFTATASSASQITLAATSNTPNDDIVVAWNTTNTFGNPIGTYTAGDNITGGGTVLYVGSAAALTNHTSLTASTQYFYKVWSVNSSVYSTGLTANATTLPAEITSQTATPANKSIALSWTNPTTSDEILVVASSSAFTTAKPTGDGTAYTADTDFLGTGTTFDGGKVIYKGTGTSVTVTNLNNKTAYNFKIFNRVGTTWSEGVEVTGTPEAIFESFADDNFTANPVWSGDTGDWEVNANSTAAAGATGSKTLRLKATVAGQTQLRTQIADWKEAQEWGFFLGRRSGQAYTDGNKVYVWLYANEEDLESATVDGYRIAIGDDTGDDEIILESVTDGIGTPVITGSSAIPNGLEDIGLLIRVTRNASGDWQLFTSTVPTANGEGAIATDKPNATNATVNQGTANNTTNTLSANGYLGIVAVHTGSTNALIAVELDQLYLDLLNSPKATAFVPADEAADIDATANLAITFDKPVVKGTGNISIRKVIDGEEVQTVDVTTASVTISGNTVTINPASDLAAGVEFYINIPKTAFQDATASFNTYTGISNNTTWNFTTQRATLVSWTFPDVSADDVEDAAIAANDGKKLATTGGTGSVGYAVPGATTLSAGTDGWNSGANTKGWQTEIVTTGYDAIKVSSKQRSATGAPQAFKLQYSLNGTDWIDVENGAITAIDDWTTGVLNELPLPVEASHQAKLFVRWLMTSDAGVTATGNTYIDDIVITGRQDIIRPTVTTLAPADNAVNVPVNVDLEITFNEAVKKGTGNILIKNASNDSNFESIDVTSGQVVIQGNKVTINLTNNLENDGRGYYVNIPNTAFTDMGNTAYSGITNKTSWSFNTVDQVGPNATAFNPNDDAVEVAVSTNLVITFNEQIAKGTGNIEIRKYDDDSVVETIDVTSGVVTVSGNQATLNPATDLALDTQYYVLIPSGVFKDNSDNPYAGIANKNTWNFKTTDGNPPLISQLIPADNTTDVDPARDFAIVFNEPVQKHTAGNIKLIDDTDGSGNQTLAITSSRIALNWNRRRLNIDFNDDLKKGHQYHIEIDAGSVKDDQNNDFAGITDATTWNFVTASRPYAVTFSPADDALDVPITDNLVITFDEDIKIGTGSIVIRDENNTDISVDVTDNTQVTVAGKVVTINPTNDLLANMNYHVRIPESAFESAASGERYRGINNNFDWNFKTVDNVAPLLVSFTPADGATGVLRDADLILDFNEPVKRGTGNITIVNENDNTKNIVINVAAPAGQILMNNTDGDRRVIIRITGDLEHSTKYHVLIANTAFKDISAAQNAFAGISDAVTWNFETVDLTPPTVTAFVPADDFTSAEVNTNLQIIFDENVQKGTGGNITITDGITPIVIPITDAQVSVANNIVTINPTNDLQQNTPYYVQIENGAIRDVNGNNFVGIADNTTWDFRTGGASFFPLDNAVDVALDVNLTLTFTKDVKIGTGNIKIVDETGGGTNTLTIPITDAQISFSGKQVIINPTEYLKNNNAYHVEIDATAIGFLTGGTYEGISNATTWNFTTINDVTAPTLTTKNPDNLATSVALGQNITLTFNEKIKGKTGGSITLSGDGVTGSPLNIPISDPQIAFAGNTMVISPTAPFINNNKTVTVDIPNSAVEDLAGNAFAGANWSFTTVNDATAPNLVSTSPANSATGVLLDANIVITFNEEIKAGTGNITINSTNIPVNDPQITYEGNSLILNLTTDFTNNTVYSINLPAGAVQDLAGNATTSVVSFSFTTVNDATKPTIVTFSPVNNATNVNLDITLQATFSESIKKGTGNITLREDGGSTITYNIATASEITVSGNTLIINPAANLTEGKTYEIGIENTAIADVAGNTFNGFTNTSNTWKFITRDLTAPTVATLSPTDDATGVLVNSNLVVTFSENIVKGAGNIVIKGGSTDLVIPVNDGQVVVATNTMTINPTNDLEKDKAYHILIDAGAVKDATGNEFAGIANATTWNFQTEADVTAPVIVSYSPADGSTGVAVNTNFVIKFDEAIQKGTGNITITDGTTPITVNVTGSEVTIDADEKTVTINPTTDLQQSKAYSINIAAGAFKDKATTPNDFAGILDNTTWNFISVDNVPPTVAGFSPADDATNIPIATNLEITFSENVKAGTGSITLKGGTSDIVINVNSGEVTFTDTKVIINPAANLEEGKNYYVNIANGAIQDISGNSYAGISDNTTWNFATVTDGIAPTATIFSPADDATGVALNTNLEITFSENVVAGTGNFIIEGGTSPITLSATDATQVTFSNNKVTLNPSLDLEENKNYNVKIQATAVKDNANNFFAGVLDATTWNFTTAADNIAPTVTTYSPANGATEVSLTTNLQITFSENVQKGTGNITLKAAGETDIVKAVTSGDVSISGNVVTVANITLVNTKQYAVLIDAGAFKDLVTTPNDYAGISTATTWQFTTLDQTAPTVVSLSPADNATGVAYDANLVITFNETVQKGTGNITLTGGTSTITIDVNDAQVTVSGTTVTINPTNLLENNKIYEVQVPAGAFKDVSTSQNSFAGITTAGAWNFQTINDQTAPTITNYSPTSGATGVAIGVNFTVTFDEAVQAGTGNITINGGASPIAIPVTSGQVTFAGNTMTINPANDLVKDTQYFITIDATAVKDAVGNNFAGIADANTWKFTTETSVTATDCATPPQQPIIVREGDNLKASTNAEAYWWLLDGVLLNEVAQTIAIQKPGTYTVVAWVGNCRSEASPGFVVAVPITAIEDLKEENIIAYPNPSEGVFFLEIPMTTAQEIQTVVYDANGTEVYANTFANAESVAIDLTALSSGKYFLKIQLGGRVFVKQLIKQ